MKKSAMLFVISLAASHVCHATHLRGGEIRIEQLSAASLTYRITVLVYLNIAGTNELFGGEDSWLDFGDGNKIQVPETPAELSPDSSTGLSRASFTVEHTFAGYQSYLVSYSEPNRSEGVINFAGSVSTKFFLESALYVGVVGSQYFSPVNYIEPSFNASSAQAYSCAFTCYDKNKARLSYELVTPHQAQNAPVLDYHIPGNVKINATSGLVSWDTKSETIVPGLYSLAVKVSQFNDNDVLLGWMIKDVEILLRDGGLPITLVAKEESMKHDLLLTEGSITIREIAGTSKNVVLFAYVYSELIGNSAMLLQQSDSSSDDARFINTVATVTSNENIKRKTAYAIVIRAMTGSSQIVDDVYLIYTDSFYTNPLPAVASIVNEELISIFPNPATEFIEIQSLRAMDNVELLSSSGQRIEISIANSLIDVRSVPNGLYFLVIEGGERKSVYRVVKK